MKADRLIRMGMRMLMLVGMKYLASGGKRDASMQQAQKAMKTANRVRRL